MRQANPGKKGILREDVLGDVDYFEPVPWPKAIPEDPDGDGTRDFQMVSLTYEYRDLDDKLRSVTIRIDPPVGGKFFWEVGGKGWKAKCAHKVPHGQTDPNTGLKGCSGDGIPVDLYGYYETDLVGTFKDNKTGNTMTSKIDSFFLKGK